jgi:hypothetical protein
VNEHLSFEIERRKQTELRGWTGHEPDLVTEELESFQGDLEVGFALGLPGLRDLATETAGMLPVKSVMNRRPKGFAPGVVREHRGPGDRLEDHPVPADRAEKREAQHQVAEACEHRPLLSRARVVVKSRHPVRNTMLAQPTGPIRIGASIEKATKTFTESLDKLPHARLSPARINQ